MSELLGKLSSYHLFNYLFPGVVFSIIATEITSYNFIYENLLISFFVFYFIGLTISRIGSLVIQPLFLKIGFITFEKQDVFDEAASKNKKIETLSESNNMYRTLVSTFLMVLAVKVVDNLPDCIKVDAATGLLITVVALLILFSFSYRKQTSHITRKISNKNNES